MTHCAQWHPELAAIQEKGSYSNKMNDPAKIIRLKWSQGKLNIAFRFHNY
jgi:hypothetical protein